MHSFRGQILLFYLSFPIQKCLLAYAPSVRPKGKFFLPPLGRNPLIDQSFHQSITPFISLPLKPTQPKEQRNTCPLSISHRMRP